MCRDCKGCVDHSLQTAAALVTAIRRKSLFGTTVPAALQGKVASAPRSKFAEEQAALSRDPLTQARMRLTEIRRQQLTGRERPVLLQGSAGDNGAYPTENLSTPTSNPTSYRSYYPHSQYPKQNNIAVNPTDRMIEKRVNQENQYPGAGTAREINLEDEKMRELAFGYSRNAKGEKVPYSELARAHTVKWTCPNCGCSYNLPA